MYYNNSKNILKHCAGSLFSGAVLAESNTGFQNIFWHMKIV